MTSSELLDTEIEIELPKSFQPLQSFVASALVNENDYGFFHQLCENVVPLLQIMPLLGPLRAKWQEEQNEYMAKLSSAEDLAKRQVKKAHAFFLALLTDGQFLSISGFEEGVKKVTDLIENRARYYTPPEYDIAYDELCSLCSLLFKNGKGDVIKGMIQITEKPEYVFENDSYSLKSIPFISHYCFGPSVLMAKSLRAEWNWKEQAPVWLIWNHLCNAAWAWHTPMDFFGNEKLKDTTPILRRRTMRLIELQNCLREMQDLKARKFENPKLNHYFYKNRFRPFLKVIIRQVAFELAKNHIEIYDNDEVHIHAIQLIMNGDELWIKIEWKENQPIEQFCLKAFQFESIPHQFMSMLMKAAPNSMLPVPGRSPADLINRCNLGKGGLKELFFGNCTKAHALFKGCRAEAQVIGGGALSELLAHLQQCHRAAGSPECF